MLAGTPQQYDVCEPPAPSGACPQGTLPALGEAGCQPAGDACPAGDFPEGLPLDKVITYVKAGAVGGNGTKAKPAGTLAEGASFTPNGGIVAVAKGTYDGTAVNLASGRDLTFWGACAAEVTVRGDASPDLFQSTFRALASADARAKLTIKNMTVGGDRPGLIAQDSDVTLSGVSFSRTVGWGILAFKTSVLSIDRVGVDKTRLNANGVARGLDLQLGARATASRLSLENSEGEAMLATNAGTSAELSDVIVRGNKGGGVNAQQQASVKIERGLVEQNSRYGLISPVGGALQLSDMVIRGTTWDPGVPNSGHGLLLNVGAQATVVRALIEENTLEGVRVWGSAPGDTKRTKLSLTDAVIRGTKATGGGDGGEGLLVLDNAEAELSHVLVIGNTHNGVDLSGPASSLKAGDLVVAENGAEGGDGSDGLGVSDGHAEIERALFDKNVGFSVRLAGANAQQTAVLRDLVLRGTTPTPGGLYGYGLFARAGAQLSIDRALVDANRGVGLLLVDQGVKATFNDVVLQGTLEVESDKKLGRGVEAHSGASLEANRLLVDTSRDVGVVVAHESSSAIFNDLTVQRGQGQVFDGTQGMGLFCGEKAHVTIKRGRFVENRSAGLIAADTGTVLEVSDLTVSDTLPQKADGRLGRGLGCQLGANLKAERLLVEGSRESGVGVALCGGTSQLTDALVRDTLAQESDQFWGVGVFSQFSSLLLTRVESRGNRGVGLLGFGGSMTLTSCTFAESKEGQFEPVSGEPVTGVADGMFLRDEAVAKLSVVQFVSNPRAGLVLSNSIAELDDTVSSGSLFGLVLSDKASSNEASCACSFLDNSTPILTDGNLSVPAAPPATPSFPGTASTPPLLWRKGRSV